MRHPNELAVSPLEAESVVEPFDCGDGELNGFLIHQAKGYQSERLAVTHMASYGEELAAYFSLLNDKVLFEVSEEQGKSARNRFNRLNRIPNGKRHSSYPALKIGRLAVSQSYRGLGVGRHLLDTIKTIALENKAAGCRFLTVDAYAGAVDFYVKNGFKFFSDTDIEERTRFLYFDLNTIGHPHP